MKRFGGWMLVFTILLSLGACKNKNKQPELSTTDITKVLNAMTDIMIHDVTNPPLASRFYSYALLSGYQIIAQNDSSYAGMLSQINGYSKIEEPDSVEGSSVSLSAVLAMLETAKRMQPTGKDLETFKQAFLDSCTKAGFDEEVIDISNRYAQKVSTAMLKYAKADKYNRISNYIRYTPVGSEETWAPTPPGNFAAVEPYFNTIRSFTLDTCSQFKPKPAAQFSRDKNSPFYIMMMETSAEEGKNMPAKHKEIASFWDCNPFALQDNGHMMIGLKKISPGAHWLGIAGIACKQSKISFSKAIKIHTVVAMGLMDGFISCWDEKYRSNRIRPETAIRLLKDPNWKPLLQTPPFPEYPSGHSTISATSATILTHFFGGNYKYSDTVEERFGLPARAFNSFKSAAAEAAISRLYGGIHYRDGVENGMEQGFKVGNWVISKLDNSESAL
ncbi:MAG: haloperoxidase [Sphingobacteriales bacterium]|nr:haloperoxidase [Sphingobacteriales bacterium]